MNNKTMTKGIKNIIFDLGGVILDIDYNRTVNAFVKLGMENFGELYSQAKQSEYFDAYETGHLSSAEFIAIWKKHLPDSVSDEQIAIAWNAIIIDMPEERMQVLDRVGNSFRIFLLSNTNALHVESFTELLDDKFGKGVFENKFEQYYYSNEIQMRKPNADAFQYVLDENDLIAKETLFIDDSIQHIYGAEKVGINAHHLTREQTILDLFKHIP